MLTKMNKNLKIFFVIFSLALILCISSVQQASAYTTTGYDVYIKYKEIYIGEDGRSRDDNHNWRISSIYQLYGSSTWYVYQQTPLGAFHSPYSHSWDYPEPYIFTYYNMPKGSRIQIIWEEYDTQNPITLHVVQITLGQSTGGESVWYVRYFYDTTQYTFNYFSASTLNKGPGYCSGWPFCSWYFPNYERLVIGVF